MKIVQQLQLPFPFLPVTSDRCTPFHQGDRTRAVCIQRRDQERRDATPCIKRAIERRSDGEKGKRVDIGHEDRQVFLNERERRTSGDRQQTATQKKHSYTKRNDVFDRNIETATTRKRSNVSRHWNRALTREHKKMKIRKKVATSLSC